MGAAESNPNFCIQVYSKKDLKGGDGAVLVEAGSSGMADILSFQCEKVLISFEHMLEPVFVNKKDIQCEKVLELICTKKDIPERLESNPFITATNAMTTARRKAEFVDFDRRLDEEFTNVNAKRKAEAKVAQANEKIILLDLAVKQEMTLDKFYTQLDELEPNTQNARIVSKRARLQTRISNLEADMNVSCPEA